MRRLLVPGLLLLSSLFAAAPAAAQQERAPQEAPPGDAAEALFEAQIGDADVELYLEGSWQASLFASVGLVVDPAGALLWQAFPGWESVPLFKQVPSLTFSVWLMQRYFLEASVVGDFLDEGYDYFDQNYLLAGYRGGEQDFLRQLLLGNQDIGIGTYPFIEAPAAGGSSLGVSAELGTGISSHELLLRFDNNERDEIVFIGANRVSEQTIALEAYQRGRFFRLPDADVEGLRVYLEDPEGEYTGTDAFGHARRYRLATAADGSIDAAAGTVSLKQPAEGGLLAYYTNIGVAGGSGGLPGESGGLIDPTDANDFSWAASFLGQPMTDREVTITGVGGCLRLYEPGEFSPFEVLGAYALERQVPEELSRLRVSVVRKGGASLQAVDPPGARLLPGADYVRFEYAAGATRYRREFYPFLDAFDADPELDPDNRLYGPQAGAPAGYLGYEILASHLTPVSDYRIGADVVPGSVQVYRNGLAETRFEVDYQAGLLTFLTEIAPSDRLEVRFRRQLSLAGNGDLLFAWGNTLAVGEALSVQLAAGLRWNLLPGTFTEEAYSRTGSVIVSAAARGQAGPLSYEASAGVSITNPDTTGVMRLLGMEATGLQVPLSEDTAWPAAAPVDDADFDGSALDAGNRGLLLYKDYRSYGVLGASALMPYTWTPPAQQIFDYATGSKPGPYTAGGSFEGDGTGRSLVLDMELDAGEWVGAQLPVHPQSGLADLSGYEGITLRYRLVDFAGSGAGRCTVYLQLGEIGEDLDGDARLDQEPSASSAGFSFDDSHAGAALRVGSGPKNTGNARRDGEDVDGSGALDPDGEGWIVTVVDPNGAMDADRDWTVLRHTFSAAERAALKRTRGLRLLVVESSGADPVSARLLVDHVSLEGSPFSATTTGGTVTAREVEEQFLAAAPAESLEEAYPEVGSLFHPLGERQKVLAIDWSGGPGDWEVRGYSSAFSEGIDYREILYYYHYPTGDGNVLEFQLRNAQGGAVVSWELPAAATAGWSEVRVSLDEGRVYVKGAPAGTVSGSLKGASIASFAVRHTAPGAASGSLYLDELHLAEPRSAVGGGATAAAQLSLPGELVSAGGRTLLRDLSLRQEVSTAGEGFSSLYGTPAERASFSSRTELGVGVSALDVKADFTVLAEGGQAQLGGGHSLSLPLGRLPLRLSDSFRLEQRAAGPALSRGDALSLSLPPLLGLELHSSAENQDDTLTQRWLGRLLLSPRPARFDTRLELSEAAEGFELPRPEGSYLANWLSSYAMLAPWRQGQALERTGRLSLAWGAATLPVGVALAGSYAFHSFDLADPSRSLASELSADLSVPITPTAPGGNRPAGAGLSLTPGYRRSLSLRGTAAGTGDFAADLDASLEDVFAQGYAFAGAPFVELYAGRTGSRFAQATLAFSEAEFEAEAYLRLSRRVSSRLVDLLLPSSLELALGRTLERAGDLTSDGNQYTLYARGAALNLFGRLGAYPLFAWYRTDEFGSALRARLRRDGAGLSDGELLLEHFASLEAESGARLSLRNRFSGRYDTTWAFDEELDLSCAWQRRPAGGVKLPLLPPALGREAYWSHQESLAMEGENAGEETSFHPVNVVLTHATALTLPERGWLKASLSLGFDLERAEGEGLYTRLGLRAGLEAQLEY